jgi:hypothetical protein
MIIIVIEIAFNLLAVIGSTNVYINVQLSEGHSICNSYI